jgi:hypothetical protein
MMPPSIADYDACAQEADARHNALDDAAGVAAVCRHGHHRNR